MKRVYLLSEEIKKKPGYVAQVQALTLNPDKPRSGRKGKHGLYGSPQWWASIEKGQMPLLLVRGVIRRIYFAGQDEPGPNNSFELMLEDGSIRDESIYVNDETDIALFRPGCRVEVVYALDEMKKQPAPNGEIDYAETPLEMAVSLDPVST